MEIKVTVEYKNQCVDKFRMDSTIELGSNKFRYWVQDHSIDGCKRHTVKRIDEYINLLMDLKKQIKNFKI